MSQCIKYNRHVSFNIAIDRKDRRSMSKTETITNFLQFRFSQRTFDTENKIYDRNSNFFHFCI
jgi:hypothetical protein